MELREAIYQIFKRHGMGKEFRLQEPMFIWEGISGKTIGKMTNPLQIKNRVLYVQVPNHAIQHELTLLKEGYIEKINQKLGRDEIKDIKFKVGDVDVNEGMMNSEEKISFDEITLSAEEEIELEQMLVDLEDGSLKESCLSFLKKLKKMKKARKQLGWEKCERCGVYHKSEGSICPSCEIEMGS